MILDIPMGLGLMQYTLVYSFYNVVIHLENSVLCCQLNFFTMSSSSFGCACIKLMKFPSNYCIFFSTKGGNGGMGACLKYRTGVSFLDTWYNSSTDRNCVVFSQGHSVVSDIIFVGTLKVNI